MIGFYVCLGVERTQRYEFRKQRVMVGSADGNDLILRDGDVPDRAFTVELIDGACLLDGQPIRDGAEIEVGDYVLILALTERTWKRLEVSDEVERRLIDAIVARDEESRLVYADWLEERGQFRRAEFLRVQDALVAMEPGDPAFAEHTRRLRVLATLIDVGWRRRIGRPAIEGCSQATCPKRWSNLAESADPKLRRCETCERDVSYCTDPEEARRVIGRGHRAVVDATVRR